MVKLPLILNAGHLERDPGGLRQTLSDHLSDVKCLFLQTLQPTLTVCSQTTARQKTAAGRGFNRTWHLTSVLEPTTVTLQEWDDKFLVHNFNVSDENSQCWHTRMYHEKSLKRGMFWDWAYCIHL